MKYMLSLVNRRYFQNIVLRSDNKQGNVCQLKEKAQRKSCELSFIRGPY